MGKYANFYDGVRKLLDKIADALDPGTADTKTANYQTAVLNSLSRIGDKVGDVVSATLPDASTATDGDTLVVADGEWTIGSGGGGGGGGVLVAKINPDTGALDKTWQEVLDASFCQIILDYGAEGKDYLRILSIYVDDGYKIDVLPGSGEQMTFTAASASDYPVANRG